MATRKIQYPSVSRVINIPVPYPTVPGGDYPDWELILKPKSIQLGSFTNTVYLPVAAVFQPYVFTSFEQPQPRKGFTYSFDDGWFGSVTPAAPSVFSQFSQPLPVKIVQQDFLDTPQSPVTPVVQTYLFSEFSQPKVTAKVFQENTFNDYEAIQNYFSPVFSIFDQPRFKQTIQDQSVQFTIFPITQVISTPVFTGFTDFGIPVTRKIQQPDVSGTLQQQVVAVVQPYVFSRFEQPQFKKQSNDQPTWFSSTVVLQSYVFSVFSQPRPLRYQTDVNIQTSYYPIAVIPPPNFTGFNDFGLAQQLLGTQQKQDGGYIQFTVLPMPQVISPYFFTGFSSFQELLPNTASRQRGLIGLGSSFNNVIIPVVQVPPDSAVGGRWYKDPFRHIEATTQSDLITKAAVKLGKMGGLARAQTLTANQRSGIATKAANIRWKR